MFGLVEAAAAAVAAAARLDRTKEDLLAFHSFVSSIRLFFVASILFFVVAFFVVVDVDVVSTSTAALPP